MEIIISFIQRAILQGTPLLFGATGEILTEKSGNLNLGIPGIMYIGAISGVVGGFFYQNSAARVQPVPAILIPPERRRTGVVALGVTTPRSSMMRSASSRGG